MEGRKIPSTGRIFIAGNPSGYQFTAAQKLDSQNLKGHQTY